MSVQVRIRREAAAFLSTFTGAQGELIADTTNNRVQVHDGTTPGGFAAAKLSEVLAKPAGQTAGDLLYATSGTAFGRLAGAATGNVLLSGGTTSAPSWGKVDVTVHITGIVPIANGGTGGSTAAAARTALGAAASGANTDITSLDGATIGATTPAAGTFTRVKASTSGVGATANLVASSNAAAIGWQATGAGTDQKTWDAIAGTGGALSFRAWDDANATSVTWLSVSRSGTTITGVSFPAPLSATSINSTPIGSTTASTLRGTVVSATTSLNLPAYTVGTLPTAGTAGREVYCSNARNSGEAAGAGTGNVVYDTGSAWRIVGTVITAAA